MNYQNTASQVRKGETRQSGTLLQNRSRLLAGPRRPPVIAEGLFSYQIGGSERVGADLALEFSRRGYPVVCFAFYDSDGPMRAELERSGIRCLDLNYERFGKVVRRATYQVRFWSMLLNERVGALHVHHATALILCGIPAYLASVPKVVMTEHGLHQLKERPRYRKSAARYCRYADEITVVEPGQAEYFRKEMGISAGKLHYVPNGVRMSSGSPEQTTEMRRRIGISKDVFAFFFVGRLSAVKDLSTLLRALSLMPTPLSDTVHLYVVGEGTERQSLEQLREQLGLQRSVTFLGVRDDVSEVLKAADAFVMSSRTEGLPMALLEAMGNGLPCIATEVGGIPELLAEDRGLLVPAQDPARLAEAMALVVSNSELRSRISQRAQAIVREHYALDPIVDRYLALMGLAPRFE